MPAVLFINVLFFFSFFLLSPDKLCTQIFNSTGNNSPEVLQIPSCAVCIIPGSSARHRLVQCKEAFISQTRRTTPASPCTTFALREYFTDAPLLATAVSSRCRSPNFYQTKTIARDRSVGFHVFTLLLGKHDAPYLLVKQDAPR